MSLNVEMDELYVVIQEVKHIFLPFFTCPPFFAASHGVELPIVLLRSVVPSLGSAQCAQCRYVFPKRTVNIRFARWVSIHSSINIAANFLSNYVPEDC